MRITLVVPILVTVWCGICLAAETPEKSVTTTWLPDTLLNTPPKALNRQMVAEVDTPARTPCVLFGVYDVENDPLSVASYTQPSHGTAKPQPDGTFLYTPKPGYVGPDLFRFTISDGRGGKSTAAMNITVLRPSGKWATTSFVELAEVQADGKAIAFGNTSTVPRVCDWDGDGLLDLLVGAAGGVWLYRNEGTAKSPRFAAGVRVQADGSDIQLGNGRVSISLANVDRDGRPDLVAVAAGDRKVRFYRNLSSAGKPWKFAAAEIAKNREGEDCVAEDVRAEVADWNGDGLPGLLTGAGAGDVKLALNVGTSGKPVFDTAKTELDREGRRVNGAYNLNVRLADVDQDGLPDFVDSYNWGTINFRINRGTAREPLLPEQGTYSVTGKKSAAVDLHQLTDGPIVDFADFNGDGTLDVVMGGEARGAVRMAWGVSAQRYLDEIEALIAAHPKDLGAYMDGPDHAAEKARMQSLQGALYDYVASFATPGQKKQIGRGLLRLIREYPQYFKLQTFDIKQQPGMPSLAVQTWLTLLMVQYYDPAARKALADAAGMTGGYRKLFEEIGLIYADNGHNPGGAEAIYQWVRTIPREIYPGTCITAADWLGGKAYLVRGHMKNTFNGQPVDGGEYGFGGDARAVIGDRGSENWFMTVVHHEASHDLDAYVRQFPELNRRWGQTLVLAGGPDMRADPKTGWLSWELTKEHFRESGLWDGEKDHWEAAWKKYWSTTPGSGWRDFGFMRGNIPWFYGASQESLATQGNQFWNSTEGRIQVAIDRWKRGYKSDITEVLFFLDIWSLNYDKVKFYENDNACNQVIAFAKLHRTRQGYIDRVDLGDRHYEFRVDDKGIVTDVQAEP